MLQRQLPASADAQTILADIIEEAKMANAIVHEVLEFVRPIRLQVEHTSWPTSMQRRHLDGRQPGAAGETSGWRCRCPDRVQPIQGDRTSSGSCSPIC